MIFRPMLASPMEIDKLQFPVYASPKLDGVRCCIVGGRPMSRSMKVIPNRFVQKILSLPQLEGLDGELCVGPSNAKNLMQMTTSGVMSEAGEPDFKYHVFDFWNDPFGRGYEYRYMALVEGFKNSTWAAEAANHLVLHRHVKIASPEDLLVFEETCLEHGFEGAMARNSDGKYKQGRSTAREGHLVKLKRFTDSEAVVVGFQQFMHNANELETDNLGYAKRSTQKDGKVPMDMLGALLVEDLKTGIQFAIGSGYDTATRTKIWLNPELYVGKIVTYKHFENAGVKDAPRFPVFKGFRDPIDL